MNILIFYNGGRNRQNAPPICPKNVIARWRKHQAISSGAVNQVGELDHNADSITGVNLR